MYASFHDPDPTVVSECIICLSEVGSTGWADTPEGYICFACIDEPRLAGRKLISSRWDEQYNGEFPLPLETYARRFQWYGEHSAEILRIAEIFGKTKVLRDGNDIAQWAWMIQAGINFSCARPGKAQS